jgi:hypothetical protein
MKKRKKRAGGKTMPEPNMLGTRYLTEEELAAAIRPDNPPSVRTLRRWNEKRIGPPRIVVGKVVVYRADAVNEWLRSLETARSEPSRRKRSAK